MKLLYVLLIPVLVVGCVSTSEIKYPSTIDKALIGTWEGGNVMKDGTNKKWKQIRGSDGDYTIFFGYSEMDGVSYETKESGRWWIEDGHFHEINPSRSSQPDIYEYEFYSKDCIKYNLLSRVESGDVQEGYSFTECRSKNASLIDDGMAFFERGEYQTAFRELLPLAEQGIAVAQLAIAVMYSDGRGVTKSPLESTKWYRQAAEQGLTHAQTSLGGKYFLGGSGVKQDHSEAVKWYRRAAKQGWTQAQFNLASMYWVGQGVSRDPIVSYKWCLLSAYGTPAGDKRERAQHRCDRVLPQLSSNDIVQAKKLASEFIPKPEITQDVAGKIYDACMRKEHQAAKSAAVDYPVVHAYSICSYYSEPCRFSFPGSSVCNVGLKKYVAAETGSKF